MVGKLSRAEIRRKYDPEVYYVEADALRDSQTLEEIEDWLKHPLTQCLLLKLEGDLSGLFMCWTNGAYTEENSSDGTNQKNLKALGMAQAIDDIITAIKHIGEDELAVEPLI
jgi:hypothetical protein